MGKILFICCFFLLTVTQILATAKFTDKDLQSKLKELAQKTDKIIITYTQGKNQPKIELKGKDVKEFFSLLKLKMPDKPYYCRCFGQLVILLYSKDKKLTGMTYHRPKSVRGLDTPIRTNINIIPKYQQKLKSFFIKHGMKFKE